MSILISDSEMTRRTRAVKKQLLKAIQKYEDLLINYGTCPNMTKAEKLKEIAESINEERKTTQIFIGE